MGFQLKMSRVIQLAFAGLVLFTVGAPTAHAQLRLFGLPRCDRDPYPQPCMPSTLMPSKPLTPDGKTPDVPAVTEPSLAPVTTAALGDNAMSFGPGYLDNAIPFTHFRLRFDAAYRDNRPDRAEYFYPKCGCFGGNAHGPPLSESSVDYQDISAYFEYAVNNRFSVFAEVPVRFLNPDNNDNTAGMADMNLGFKYAFVANERRFVTFQGRIFLPTGDGDRGLGNDHVSLEPSLLYNENVTDRLTVYAQLGDWIPVGGSEFAGNILRYGVGASYAVVDSGRFRAAPVVELLGWTVLGGRESVFPTNAILNASGDTIINAKIGVRFGFAPDGNTGLFSNSDIYIGYGRALTGEVWYKDILRLEYRLRF
ncbi:MAG: hypothetical protein HY040_11495 [Planctomycetes bacterium]|nr:hypothetical protein [Planctomycetota bacterium]